MLHIGRGGVLIITELNFIEQIKRGNEKALEYVIDHYGWLLKTVIKKHLHYLPNLYEECMNDCLLAVWNHIDSYDPAKNSFKNWIGGIAKYKSIDYVRKYLKDLENETIEDVIIPIEDNTLHAILAEAIDEEIERMLRILSEEDREIFRKLYLEEQDMNEISQETGFSRAVLYNRISRGRRKIRNQIRGGRGYEKS